MTSDFSDFTARLREFVQSAERAMHSETPSIANEMSFNELALELFRLQFAHNASYRRLCKARGVSPQDVTGWAQVPAAPTAAFKEFELSCLPEAERTAVFHSSGTTAQRPSRHFHNAASLAIYRASL